VSALAEGWYGKGKGIDNFVEYSLGIRIGAGVIVDGTLSGGKNSGAAEVGHTTVDMEGDRCACGNVGCLELYGSFLNLVKNYKRKKRFTGLEDFNPEEGRELRREISQVFREASLGAGAAEKTIRSLGKILGIGGITLANMFHPEYIFVSSNDMGDIDLEMVTEEIRKAVGKQALSEISREEKVETSGLGEDIHLYGGFALVLQNFFSTLKTAKLPE
jgi:glucokinase